MSGKIILQIVKIILRIMKTILRIVGLETGYAERSRKCQEIELAHIAECSRKSQRKCQEKVHLIEPICTNTQ